MSSIASSMRNKSLTYNKNQRAHINLLSLSFFVYKPVYLIELLSHVKVQINAVKGGCPFIVSVGRKFPVFLHIWTSLNIAVTYDESLLSRLCAVFQLKSMIKISRSSIIISIRKFPVS